MRRELPLLMKRFAPVRTPRLRCASWFKLHIVLMRKLGESVILLLLTKMVMLRLSTVYVISFTP